MLKLIKTEIIYYRWLYILSLLLVIIINFGLTMDNRWIEAQGDFPGQRIIWLGIGIVVLFATLLFNRKSGRLRNNILLPLSNIQLALARVVPFILFWVTLSFLLIVFYFININTFPTSDWILYLISLTGVILLINSIPVLNTDFYSTFFSKRSRIILGVSWAILWITYIELNLIFSTYIDFISPVFFEISRETLKELYLSRITTIISIVVGGLLFFGSLFTFSKRKLFLE